MTSAALGLDNDDVTLWLCWQLEKRTGRLHETRSRTTQDVEQPQGRRDGARLARARSLPIWEGASREASIATIGLLRKPTGIVTEPQITLSRSHRPQTRLDRLDSNASICNIYDPILSCIACWAQFTNTLFSIEQECAL